MGGPYASVIANPDPHENLRIRLVLGTNRPSTSRFGQQDGVGFVDWVTSLQKNGMFRTAALDLGGICLDAFQATFFILASRANVVDWQDSVGGWLHQVARRVSLKLKSDLARRRRLESDAAKEELDQCGGPDQSVGIHELGQILDQEISRLPRSFREVILLTQCEGLSRSEAATRLGISVAAVKDRLERGREWLQKQLLKRGLSLSAVALAAWLVPNCLGAANVSVLVAKTSQLAIAFASGKLIGAPFTAAASLANGTLKLLGMQKMAMALTLFLSLITGGSLVYGFLQDNPTRFESGLRGTIVQIDDDQPPSITIEQSRRFTDKELYEKSRLNPYQIPGCS